jgi:hypothetical protein
VQAALQYGGNHAPPWLLAYAIADRLGLDPVVVRKTWTAQDLARALSYLRNLPERRT